MDLEQLVIFFKIALELHFREQMNPIFILTKGPSLVLGLYLHRIVCFLGYSHLSGCYDPT